MGNAHCVVENDTEFPVRVNVFNYADSIRTVPKESHYLSPGQSVSCEAAPHGSGVILGIGKTYMRGENDSRKYVTDIVLNGNGGFWHKEIGPRLRQAKRALEDANAAVRTSQGRVNDARQAVQSAKAALAQANASLEDLKQQRQRLMASRQQVVEEKVAVAKQSSAARQLMNKLKGQLEDLEDDGEKQQIVKVGQDLKTAQAREEAMQQQIDTLTKKLQVVEEEIATTQNTVQQRAQEAEKKEREAAAAEKAFNSAQTALREHKQSVHEQWRQVLQSA